MSDQRARAAAQALVAGWECGCCPECEKKMCEHSVSYIADAIAQAVAAERQAHSQFKLYDRERVHVYCGACDAALRAAGDQP